MVTCSTPGTTISCSNGALAGVFLYTGTGTELNVADGETAKVQIITNAYVCDDAGFVPTEYCMDWGDGTQTTSTFPNGYATPKNVELSHVYRFAGGSHSETSMYIPVVTIFTACGGVRATTGSGQGVSLMIYCHMPGVTIIPAPNMSSYRLYSDFSYGSCAGISPTPDEKCVEGSTRNECVAYADGDFYQKCLSGVWRRDTSAPCGNDGGYVPPSVPPYVPPYVPPVDTGDGGGTDILAQITDFYENNKTVSILGIALLGGVILLGGN
jgi:hypothetical protein